jgi:hypothetical protein
MMRGRRLWLKVQAHGSVIPVYVSKTVVDDDGVTEIFGYFDSEAPLIIIRAMDNIASMKQTLHHELLHVCFGAHSGDAREMVFKGKTRDGRAKREEEIISFLEPVQFDLLVRNGWLRYPNPPRLKR